MLVVLFALAFAVRLGVGAVLLARGTDAFVLASDDGDAYDAAARWQAFGEPITLSPRMAAKWSSDSGVMERWPQGYWLFLAAQYATVGSAYRATVVAQALIGAGGVMAGYALARAVLSARGALLAGLALALSSTSIYLSAALYAESLYIPLILAGLALVSHAVLAGGRGRARWLAAPLAGVAFGLAEATRPLALAVLAAALIWCLAPDGRPAARDRVGRALEPCQSATRVRGRRALGVCLGFGVAIAPFVAHDLFVLGRVATFTVGGAEAHSDLLGEPALGLATRLVLLFASGGWGPLGEPLVSWMGAVATPLRSIQALVGGLGLVWLVCRRTRTQPVGWLLLLASLAVLGPPLFLGLPLVRYRAPADPLLIIGMVVVLEASWRLISRYRGVNLRPQPSAEATG